MGMEEGDKQRGNRSVAPADWPSQPRLGTSRRMDSNQVTPDRNQNANNGWEGRDERARNTQLHSHTYTHSLTHIHTTSQETIVSSRCTSGHCLCSLSHVKGHLTACCVCINNCACVYVCARVGVLRGTHGDNHAPLFDFTEHSGQGNTFSLRKAPGDRIAQDLRILTY